jgi:hypothetical protein
MEVERGGKKKQSKEENLNFMFVCILGTKQPLLDKTWTAKEMVVLALVNHQNLLHWCGKVPIFQSSR